MPYRRLFMFIAYPVKRHGPFPPGCLSASFALFRHRIRQPVCIPFAGKVKMTFVIFR
jgi:hypothetical protein